MLALEESDSHQSIVVLLQQLLRFDLLRVAFLRLIADCQKRLSVHFPEPQPLQIGRPSLVIDEERDDLTPEALLEQEQPPYPAVTVLKGLDGLKEGMKFHHICKAVLMLRFVFADELGKLGVDLPRRRSLGYAKLSQLRTVVSYRSLVRAVIRTVSVESLSHMKV